MNRCNNCKVRVYDSEKSCPLCHAKLDNADTGASTVEYPNYHDIKKYRSVLWNVPFFVAFTGSIICVYINLFSHREGQIIWSVIVVAALLISSAILSTIQSVHRRFGSKILWVHILVSTLLFIVDLSTGMRFWSTNYVFPFLNLAATIFLTVLAARSERLFSEYFGYILVVTLIGLVPIPIYLLGFSDSAWGMFVSVLFSAIIAVGLYLFADRPFKEEIKKRFHR